MCTTYKAVACQNIIIYSLRARETRQRPVPPMYHLCTVHSYPKNERLRTIENRMNEKTGREIKKDNMIKEEPKPLRMSGCM
jgi:hypothetical protein